jgi:SAM-dependent methyltransferase
VTRRRTLESPAEGGREHPTEPYDFRQLDFERLWEGRERTTALEQAIVTRALSGGATSRVLEVGPGGGRLTPALTRQFTEYVGVDVTLEFLQRLRARPNSPRWLLAADVHHPPFVEASFAAVVMVRIYNFLVDPGLALREMCRLLVPGGFLLLSYHPDASFATVHHRLRQSLRPPTPSGAGPVKHDRSAPELPSRTSFRRTLSRSGFETVSEFATGMEDYWFGRRVPTRTHLGLSELVVTLPLYPQRFVLARKPGTPVGRLPLLDRILACPRCRTGFGPVDFPPKNSLRCAHCGFEAPVEREVPDLRDLSAPAP